MWVQYSHQLTQTDVYGSARYTETAICESFCGQYHLEAVTQLHTYRTRVMAEELGYVGICILVCGH